MFLNVVFGNILQLIDLSFVVILHCDIFINIALSI